MSGRCWREWATTTNCARQSVCQSNISCVLESLNKNNYTHHITQPMYWKLLSSWFPSSSALISMPIRLVVFLCIYLFLADCNLTEISTDLQSTVCNMENATIETKNCLVNLMGRLPLSIKIFAYSAHNILIPEVMKRPKNYADAIDVLSRHVECTRTRQILPVTLHVKIVADYDSPLQKLKDKTVLKSTLVF